MDRAKETIAKSFQMKEQHDKEALGYIDNRWNCSLHAAGYFLDPTIYYDNPEAAGCEEFMGWFDCRHFKVS